jgi:hypothetical protein
MKTEKEIKVQLKLAKKNLSKTQKQFEKYDNHDNHEDMDAILVFEQEVKTLEWVLGKMKGN